MLAGTPGGATTDQALDEALADVDALAEHLVGLVQQRVGAYATVPPGELIDGVADDLRRGLRAMRECRPPTEQEREQSAAVGALRATQGVPVEAMIEAFQLCVEELCRSVLARAEDLGAPPGEMLEMTQGAWVWANSVMTSAAREHRRVDLDAARRDLERRTEFVHALLFGSLGPADLAVNAATYRLDPNGRYRVVRARAADEAALETLRRVLARANHDGPGAALATIEGDLAGVIGRLPGDLPPGVCVGISGVAGLSVVSHRFAEASSALATAAAFGLGGYHDLDSLGLRATVHDQPASGERSRRRHLAAIADGPIPETLRVLLACDLRVEDAAARLFVHPNTVRKRVARYQSLTGADLRRVDDLVELWWALRSDEIARAR